MSEYLDIGDLSVTNSYVSREMLRKIIPHIMQLQGSSFPIVTRIDTIIFFTIENLGYSVTIFYDKNNKNEIPVISCNGNYRNADILPDLWHQYENDEKLNVSLDLLADENIFHVGTNYLGLYLAYCDNVRWNIVHRW